MNSDTPNFVYFGSEGISIVVLEILEREGLLPGLIVAQPDKPKGRKMELTSPAVIDWARARSIPTIQPESLKGEILEELTETTAGEEWDAFIVVSYGKIIPQQILDLPAAGTLNIHPSLLPELRGPSPIQSAILEDKKQTGVTLMLLDEEMDHGPIVAQASVAPEPWPIDAISLEEILSNVGGELLAENLLPFINGDIGPEEQDHDKATYCSYLEKSQGEINLEDDPYKNFLKIQGLKGWPGTYFFIQQGDKEIRVKIVDAHLENNTLVIERVIPEGKKEMDYEDFIRNL